MVKLDQFKTSYQMPPYSEMSVAALRKKAINADTQMFQRSDADFKKRHGGIVSAEKALEAGVANDFRGESTLMPQMQAELMKAGLSKSLDNLGDTMTSEGVSGETLKAGSAGEANLAAELGIGIAGFQDRNRKNREATLGLAETLMPRRTFGFGGNAETMIEMMNKGNQNAWNQAWFADKRNAEQFKWGLNQQNKQAGVAQGNSDAAADAAEEEAMISGGAAIASAAIIALCLCWIARLVFGETNPQWRIFRKWMLDNCPGWMINRYGKDGQDLAAWLTGKRLLCGMIRLLMQGCTNRLRLSWARI